MPSFHGERNAQDRYSGSGSSFAHPKQTGKNGDKLHLTIHAIAQLVGYPATPIMLTSTLGGRHYVWWGFVGN